MDEIPRRKDFHPPCAQRLGRPRIQTGEIRNGTPGGVFHGDAPDALEETGQSRVELFPSGVDEDFPGQVVEIVPFDGVDERTRGARGRDAVVPAARRHVRGRVQSRDADRDRVRAVEVV